jgi:NH3-dependent NAD+ synthetase
MVQLFKCRLEPNWWNLQNRSQAFHSLRSDLVRLADSVKVTQRPRYGDTKLTFSFLDAIPSAELIPIGEDKAVQSDEVEMGMTYDELSVYGRLRKVEKCGPYSMFGKLIQEWGTFLSPLQVSQLGNLVQVIKLTE